MPQASTNEFRIGMKVEIDQQPYVMVENDFVKPGKGQPFNRTKLKNLRTGRVIERTFKSGEKIDLADVEEKKMRLSYQETDGVVFMDDTTFDQVHVAFNAMGESKEWLMENMDYQITFHKGEPIVVTPPTFMEVTVTQSATGLRGDTTGRVLKPAVIETGMTIQVPLFINEGDKIKVDTRTGEYVGRA